MRLSRLRPARRGGVTRLRDPGGGGLDGIPGGAEPPAPAHRGDQGIGRRGGARDRRGDHARTRAGRSVGGPVRRGARLPRGLWRRRSEEHTSELQSLAYLVCRLLLEKKKKSSKKQNSDC